MSRDIVIVGAGPGGLASAILLAGAGLRVRVLERKNRVGGRTAAIEENGFRFDTGPTFFLYPRVLEEIYEAVGRDLHREVDLIRLDPQYRLVFGGGGVLDATPRIDEMKRQLERLSPHDGAGFVSFLEDNRRKLEAFRPILENPFDSWRDTARLDLATLLPLIRPWASLDRDLRRHFSDPRVRLAFSFQSKYLGMSPFNCPSLFSILSFLEYEYGVFHPRGGCAAVIEAMANTAEELGAEIHLDEPVEEILFEGKRAVGVRTPLGDYPADALVVNADFAAAMRRLVPDRLRRRWTDRQLEEKRYSCSTFMLYLGVEGRFEDLPHHTIYISEDYEGNLADVERHHRLSQDPSFYVQNATVTDRSLAPPGCSTLYVLAPVTHQHPNVDWSREAEPFRRRLLKQLGKIGIGGLEGRIRFAKTITPADWENDHRIYRGATFNLAHSLSQMLHLRPHNRFEDLESVYLVGGGTHPGSGLPVIFESARISSRLLVEDLGIEEPWPLQAPRVRFERELREAV